MLTSQFTLYKSLRACVRVNLLNLFMRAPARVYPSGTSKIKTRFRERKVIAPANAE